MLHTSQKKPLTPFVQAASPDATVMPGAEADTAAPPVSPSVAKTTGLPMWKGTVLARNAKGYEDAYAIGLDGYVWTYRIDGVTGQTGRLMCTWLKAHTFALASSSSGRALLVGGRNCTLSYVQELGDSNIWWTRPVTVDLPAGMSQCLRIENIRARSANGTLYVVVDTRHAGTGGECLVQTWESVWDCQGMNVQPSPWRLRGTAVSRDEALTLAN
jgi:hypothetical protein